MADRPNILIFMTDQQQAATVEPGHPCHTPRATAFALQGMRFDRAYTPVALCAPARASFMTSVYPTRHGMLNNNHVPQAMRRGLAPDVVAWSRRMREAGYRLLLCGTWHASAEQPASAYGWEEPDAATQRDLWTSWHGRREPDRGFQLERPGYDPYWLYGEIRDESQFSEPRWTAYGIDRLRELARGKDPWVLMISVHGPHDPYVAPSRHVAKYDPAKVPLPENFDDALTDKPAVYRREREELWGKLTRRQYGEAIAHYWAYVTFMDELFGLVVDALDATGQAERTLALFTADHGEMMGAHGLFFKGVTAFDECYRVPLLARRPGVVPAGAVCDEFVSHLDMGPTFVELGGAAPLPEAHGRSYVPLLRGTTPADWPQEFFAQFHGSELYYTQRLLIGKKWKYVFNGFDFDELYDREADPHEMRNLYRSAAHRPVVAEVVGRMWKRALAVGDGISCHQYPTTDLVPVGPNAREK